MIIDEKEKTMKMVCEYYYIPKDDIIGEDALFICEEEEIIGVADGVGGWAKRGIDAGEYARQLMNNSVEAIFFNNNTDPKTILKEAYMANAEAEIQGSSTACIIRHNNGILETVNIGDSGFMIFRENKFIYKSKTQQWKFNSPYQLGNSKYSDIPELARTMKIAVIPGDVIVLATDGLFDNLFISDIEENLKSKSSSFSVAFSLAELSRRYSLMKDRKSPFSKAAAKAGLPHTGGKFDDITVIVARIISQ